MASTPTPQEPLLHIKSAARKLPIKRKSPSNPHSSILDPSPLQSIKPQPPSSSSSSFSIIVDDGEGRGGSVYGAESESDSDTDADADADTDADADAGGGLVQVDVGGSAVPFKFHRIWSESDEIRFLQGLLACHSQGLVFPRDLNVFFDRFSDTMTQPYTRSQLSEKLRRLRKKFRIVSSRVARGRNPNSLSPHDRDLFHLSNQLWNPSFAAASPFAASGPDASKRRRRLPPPSSSGGPVTPKKQVLTRHTPQPTSEVALLMPPPAFATPACNNVSEDGKGCPAMKEESLPAGGGGKNGSTLGQIVIKAALDVFDSSLEQVKSTLDQDGLLFSDNKHILKLDSGRDLTKRWQEQRVAELNVVARRLRLVIENSIQK